MALNTLLVSRVDDLHLSTVVEKLIGALELIGNTSESDQASKINSIMGELISFSDDVLWLKGVHNTWQAIDKHLSLLETNLSSQGSVDEALFTLSEIELLLAKGFEKEKLPDQYVATMSEYQVMLTEKLIRSRSTQQNTSDLRRALILFTDPARKIFRMIDKRLKVRCKDLVKLEGIVNELLHTQN